MTDQEFIEAYSKLIAKLAKKCEECADLKAELKRERECVDFYADKNNWHQGAMCAHEREIFTDDWYDLDSDKKEGKYIWYGGKRARETQKLRDK